MPYQIQTLGNDVVEVTELYTFVALERGKWGFCKGILKTYIDKYRKEAVSSLKWSQNAVVYLLEIETGWLLICRVLKAWPVWTSASGKVPRRIHNNGEPCWIQNRNRKLRVKSRSQRWSNPSHIHPCEDLASGELWWQSHFILDGSPPASQKFPPMTIIKLKRTVEGFGSSVEPDEVGRALRSIQVRARVCIGSDGGGFG